MAYRTRSLAAAWLCALALSPLETPAQSPAAMRALAHSYYEWRDSVSPVSSSDQGKHTWDDKLDDYRMSFVLARRAHVKALLAQVKAMNVDGWSKDDRIDWLLLRSELTGADFYGRVMQSEESDPQLYANSIANGIFSLIKKDYAPRNVRARAATARLRNAPAMLALARTNLVHPVRLFAQLASEAAHGGDDLYTVSLMTIADSLPPSDRTALVSARDAAIKALHEYADWLDKHQASMPAWRPIGPAQYEMLLRDVMLLPVDASQVAMLGESELARYRGLEGMLKNPSMAFPDPARVANIPRDQAAFLGAYEARENEILEFLRTNHLVTLPPYLGHFEIRQLPDAFKPTSPGGFMNPPGIYDNDPTGFYFIPTYNPKSGNFYIRAAIEEPRPILGHEGIPGHFLQLSIANHLVNEIRRQHSESSMIEGWALYCEEMLLRAGFYPVGSAGEGQVLRLGRYRAARIGVDVNLHTGRWTFDQAVRYFMEAGGLDREAATGEAAGAAASPTQKITYMVGKWQLMRLLGKFRDQQGANFRLGDFHDKVISYGSLPVSVIEWMMVGDSTGVAKALHGH